MRIAIIGGGTAGLTCAYLLHRQHEVTVFEAASAIGGSNQTTSVSLDGTDFEIDLSLCVFNSHSCPSFLELLGELKVALEPSDMSFSVSDPLLDLEYGSPGLDALFATRRNLLSLPFWDMLLDIRRFHRESLEDYQSGRIAEQLTLRDYLGLCRYSRRFVEHYVVPMSSAICSLGQCDPLELPLLVFMRQFRHHGLPTAKPQAPWYRFAGGARSYLANLTRGFQARIRLNSPVLGVTRDRFGVTVNSRTGPERFDKVIFACRSDQALGLLDRPCLTEQLVLGAPEYSRNDVILHTDTRLLPRRRHSWASWNYRAGGPDDQPAALTCHLNRLQGVRASETLCLSINQTRQIDPARIIARHSYLHPRHSLRTNAAKAGFDDLQGNNHSYFCGAWWGNGQHEDAVLSARQVADAIAALRGRTTCALQRQDGLATVSTLPRSVLFVD